ncbi:MAG: Prepilin-type cleavage/methylation domain containing protein [Desulfotomaculum sp. 46_296]|nr:MAG: Prepilin-type cleavage/methylation domain containing protein [Desulfotomaculum sp. 46_296]KUK84624.1 MAG: Prepilin-type cleavage/methylation domain containing protein [Desulfofundulus kuznetsovii]HAU32691.1 hypothetical protein [Desulfotomaculum sp.]
MKKTYIRYFKKLCSDQHGVGLLEITAVLFFLAVVTIPLINFFISGNRFTAQARHEVAALNLAQEILEETKSVPENQIGVALGGSASTITLAGTKTTDGLYNGDKIATTGGTGSGQIRTITGYAGSTRVATITTNWTTSPDSTTSYIVFEKSDSTPYTYSISVTNGTNNLKTVTVLVNYEAKGISKSVSLTGEIIKR